jgi:RHS repeat-associated protein
MKQITNPDNNMWRSADQPQRTERVAARIGGGGLYAIDREHRLSDKSGSVFKQSLRQINERHLENNEIDCIANGLSSNDKLTIDMNEVPERLQAKLRVNYSEFRHTIADAQSIHHNEPDVYFYHSDHLGSASWITDKGGLAVQHLQYLPFGESFVNQHTSGYEERFTFTGKEKDSESGFYYFGARYYDCDLSGLFLSVDPMADKYPSISPYAYCAWNPVKLVDPDGMDTIVGIDINKGTVSFCDIPNSFGNRSVEFISDNEIIYSYQCDGDVSVSRNNNSIRTIDFDNLKDANNVYDFLMGKNDYDIDSDVEWSCYDRANGSGLLVTSSAVDRINVDIIESGYVDLSKLRHYHPGGRGYSLLPSPEDIAHSNRLNIPSYLSFCGKEYRFDNIAKKYDSTFSDYKLRKTILDNNPQLQLICK